MAARRKTVGTMVKEAWPLESEIKRRRGHPVAMTADVDDIGGELLSILSKGLYTNPLDCLREYAQNGVDAGATTVSIKITGNAVSIMDNGHGMNLDDMRQARKVGFSPKSITEHVGFRGIGLYSGFDLCRELSIISTKLGSVHSYLIVFKFQAMKAQLDRERAQPPGGARSSLVEILSRHTEITLRDDEVEEGAHWTMVTLQDVSPEHVARISQKESLRSYLLSNLPIDFSDGFKFAAELRAKIRDNVPGYRAIRVSLQLPGDVAEVVEKYAPMAGLDLSNLLAPIDVLLTDTAGSPVAFYWACLNGSRSSIDSRDARRGDIDGSPRYAGLIYKMKGFSIGNRDRLRAFFEPRAQVYGWFTGEVYILDTKVIPNAERNEFESSPAKQGMVALLQTSISSRLVTRADVLSRVSRAESKIQSHGKQIELYEQALKGDIVSGLLGRDGAQVVALGDILNIVKDLKKRRGGMQSENPHIALAKDLEVRARRIQSSLDKYIREPGQTISKRRKATRQGAPVKPADVQNILAAELPPSIRDVLGDAGWTLDDELSSFVDIIQDGLESLFSAGSNDYRRFLNYIAERVNDQDED